LSFSWDRAEGAAGATGTAASTGAGAAAGVSTMAGLGWRRRDMIIV
jgi:hypothetical protein